MSHVGCHVSRVTCHVSHVTCHMSHFTFFVCFLGQSGGGSCYQRGLPRLVLYVIQGRSATPFILYFQYNFGNILLHFISEGEWHLVLP